MTPPSLRPAATPEIPLADLARLLPGSSIAEAGETSGASGASGASEVRVTGVTLDSRQVRPGDLYAALPGAHVHGARFAAEALAAGAAAVFTDPAGAEQIAAAGVPVPLLITADPRDALGGLAATAYGDPSSKLHLLGVTGTNGKTTVSYLLEAGLRAAGHRTGLIGTVETRIGDEIVPSVRTTPEAPELQALFAAMSERGVTAAAMEVSSHALALHRVDGCRFTGAAFTNLSQDHLDFHGSIEEYFQAKALLFDAQRGLLPPGAKAVLAADDEYGRRLAQLRADADADADAEAVTFGAAADADWRVTDVAAGPDGSRFTVRPPSGKPVVAGVQLPGSFNVTNALCALALLVETGIPVEAALAGVAGLTGVPGRMERVDAGQPYLALVDYAHTPAAVSGLLEAVRGLVRGRVILVLGCGGDRDKGKRPLMGAAAVQGADLRHPHQRQPALGGSAGHSRGDAAGGGRRGGGRCGRLLRGRA